MMKQRWLAAIVFALLACGAGVPAARAQETPKKDDEPPPPLVKGPIIVTAPKGRAPILADPVVTASPAKEKDIRRLLELTDIIAREVQAIDPLFEAYRKAAPQVPQNVWEELKKEFKSEFSAESIAANYVPLYNRFYSHDEIKQLIKFYESPVGRKMVQSIPLIEREVYAIGWAKGMRVGQRVRERLKAKGYDLPIA